LVHVHFAIIHPDAQRQEFNPKGDTRMKKILALAIGFGLVLGTVSFAQDKMDDKKTEKKKKGKKKTDDKKMDDKKM
jgi:hypothetical protein